MKALVCIFQFFNLINESKGFIVIVNNDENESSDSFEIQAKVDPSKLYGIEVFWKIVQEASDNEVMEKSRDFLNKIYTQLVPEMDTNAVKNSFIETYLDRLAKTIDDPNALEKMKLNKMIMLMENIITESEKKGTGGIQPYKSIINKSVVSAIIRNYINNNKGIPNVLEVELYSNTTIWELKTEIGKYFNCSPECMSLSINFNELQIADHGKCLSDCVPKDFTVIGVNRKDIPDIPKAKLLNEDNTLTEMATKIFTDVFNKFSADGKMNKYGCADFLNTALGIKTIGKNDKEVRQFFKDYDKDEDEYLLIGDFCEFYRSSLVDNKEETTWKNLINLGYRYDLKSIDEVSTPIIDQSTLPRYILSLNPKSFELFLKALDKWGSKVEFVWMLMNNLVINQEIYQKIKELTTDWNTIMDTPSTFKRLYCLQIIKSFLNTNGFVEWKQQFVEKGGFSFLANLLIKTNVESVKTMEKYENITLGNLIGSINSFIIMAAFTLNKELLGINSDYMKNWKYNNENEKLDKEQAETAELLKAKPSKLFFPKYTHKGFQGSDVGVLSEAQANIVFNDLKDKEIWKKGFDILAELFFSKEKLESYDEILANIVICFLNFNMAFGLDIFNLFKSYSNKENDYNKITLFGLLHVDSDSIRNTMLEKLHFQCYLYKNSDEKNLPLDYFLRLLIDSIPQTENDSIRCKEFFKLMNRLIDIYYRRKDGDKLFDEIELIDKLLKTINNDNFSNESSAGLLLIGAINTLNNLFNHNISLIEQIALEKGVLKEIFCNYLFPEKENNDKAKCKTKSTREEAYELLLTLCKKNIKIQSVFFHDYIEGLLTKIQPITSWDYDPSDEGKSKHGYVGIKNLGCICYMISILQQFYMVPSFRYGILSIKSNPQEDEEDLIYQLRKLFSYLEASQRECYNPKPFCNAYKDFDGNPTNTSIQQDAHEFLNMVFERMENEMSRTSQRYLVNSIFGGKMCSKIICKGGCGTVRNNYENFYNVSLEVRGFKTLANSMKKFVSGDNIEDYMCDKCNKKVTVTKRLSISKLPNVLIVHLQRIVYNFDTLANDKINSRLEFPKDFSIEPYTTEGIERKEHPDKNIPLEDPSYYCYKLAGIVVHRGTADAGHYYSFINTNRKCILYHIY